ncbi:hypothetical protein Tco_0444083 [Tanacetum coccineum]
MRITLPAGTIYLPAGTTTLPSGLSFQKRLGRSILLLRVGLNPRWFPMLLSALIFYVSRLLHSQWPSGWCSRHDHKRFKLKAIDQDHDEGLFGVSP